MTAPQLFDVDAPMQAPPGEHKPVRRMPARVRQADPVESWEAAMSLSEQKIAELDGLILDVLRAHGALIPQQIAVHVLDLRPGEWVEGSVRTRMRPLERRGLVREMGERGQTSRGRSAAKWVAA